MERAFAIQGLVAVVSRFNSQAILIFHAADFEGKGVAKRKKGSKKGSVIHIDTFDGGRDSN